MIEYLRKEKVMYLRRKIDQFLIDWKNLGDHKPLIINGARQVGKTESIMHFATNNYSNIIYLNFAIKLGNTNIGCANNIYSFPYFCAFLIRDYLKNRIRFTSFLHFLT